MFFHSFFSYLTLVHTESKMKKKKSFADGKFEALKGQTLRNRIIQ